MSLFFHLFNVAINLWHRKLITADVTAHAKYTQNTQLHP